MSAQLRLAAVFVLSALAALASCSNRSICPSAQSVTAATASSPSRGGMRTAGTRWVKLDDKHRIWTRRVGDGPIKLLVLPGGPRCSHEYFEVFEDFLLSRGVELIYYDPLGTGASVRPEDASRWTMQGFVEEVETVRAALGLEDFYMLGHSAGGWIAIEYALTHPGHLRGLILSNTNASIRSWLENTDQVVAEEAPPDVTAKLRDCKARGDGECYAKLSDPYMDKRYLDVEPRIWPTPVFVACFGSGSNAKMEEATLGVWPFQLLGSMSKWDRWKELDQIHVRTLVIGSKRDIHAPADIARMAARIPGAKLAMLERGSHFSMYDNQDAYFAALTGFLESVEAARAKRLPAP